MNIMRKMKAGLAVFLTVLMCTPTAPAYAEESVYVEMAEAEGAVLSDKESVDAEADIAISNDEGIITGYVNGTDNAVSWTYDPETKTAVVTGKGTRVTGYEGSFPEETKKIIFEDCEIEGSYAYLFADLENLISIYFTGLKMTNATTFREMFYGCSNLSSLDVSGFDTGNVTDMEGMFSGCSSLTDLDVSGFETGNVTYMYYMFDGCSSLSSLDVSGFDTGSVTDMSYMFGDCSNLSSLDASGFETGNVTDMDSMFYDCSNLASLKVNGFETGNVTYMEGMFWDCSNLSSLATRSQEHWHCKV